MEHFSAGRVLMLAAAFVIVVMGMKLAASMIVPFMLSVFIALLCSPALLWMKSRHVPGWLAILLIVLTIGLAGVLVGAVVGSSISAFRADLPFYEQKLQDMLGGLQAWLAGHGFNLDLGQLREALDPGMAMTFVGNILSSLGGMMTNALLIMLTVIFILTEEVGFGDKLRVALGGLKRREESDALEYFAVSINRYLVLKTWVSLLTGALVSLLLWVIGVDYPLMWGMLAFLLNFVPTIGSLIAAVPAVMLAAIQLGLFEASLVVAGYSLINVGVGNVLEPRLMGRGLNLSPLVVFLSLVFWGWVLGPVGMLLSIPLTIMVKIVLESDPDTRWIAILLGAGVPPEPVLAGKLEADRND